MLPQSGAAKGPSGPEEYQKGFPNQAFNCIDLFLLCLHYVYWFGICISRQERSSLDQQLCHWTFFKNILSLLLPFIVTVDITVGKGVFLIKIWQ